MDINKSSGQRDITIDIAKGVGMLLVVIGHLPTVMGGGNIHLSHGLVLYAFRMVLQR